MGNKKLSGKENKKTLNCKITKILPNMLTFIYLFFFFTKFIFDDQSNCYCLFIYFIQKKKKIASFPNSPQQPQEHFFPQPIIHNTADNKDNSIDLANIFGASVMDATVPCNLLPVSSDVHWISQNPQPAIW